MSRSEYRGIFPVWWQPSRNFWLRFGAVFSQPPSRMELYRILITINWTKPMDFIGFTLFKFSDIRFADNANAKLRTYRLRVCICWSDFTNAADFRRVYSKKSMVSRLPWLFIGTYPSLSLLSWHSMQSYRFLTAHGMADGFVNFCEHLEGRAHIFDTFKEPVQ